MAEVPERRHGGARRVAGLGAVGPGLAVYSDYETDVTGPYPSRRPGIRAGA